jgi:cytochrome P450
MTGMLRARQVQRPPGPDIGPLEILRLMRTRRPTDFLEQAATDSPTLAHFRLGREHMYVLGTPELIRGLLLGHGRVTAKGRGLEQARRLLGQGLLTSEGDLHRRQRRLLQPAFHPDRIRTYANEMRAAAVDLPAGAGWRDGEVRDVAAEMRGLTLRIVGRTLFATDLAADATGVATALTTFLGRAQRVMVPGGPLLNRLPLPSTRRLAEAGADLDRVVYRLIGEHRATGDRGDMLSMLLAARDDDGTAMPDRQVRDEALTLMLAGHETTANALAWAWLLLDRHPEAARRLHAEVDPLPTAPTYDDLDRLLWTRAVVAETLRLYPPAWVVGRRMLADVTLDGWTVPARSICVASQWVTHRDPRWWTEPLAYHPERWLDAAGRYDENAPGQPRGAYFPFGLGRRVCIGESFAWTEAVLVLATMARDWAPTLVPGHPVDVRPAITLRPAHGLRMTLHRRRPAG